jgi:hypothetical protein
LARLTAAGLTHHHDDEKEHFNIRHTASKLDMAEIQRCYYTPDVSVWEVINKGEFEFDPMTANEEYETAAEAFLAFLKDCEAGVWEFKDDNDKHYKVVDGKPVEVVALTPEQKAERLRHQRDYVKTDFVIHYGYEPSEELLNEYILDRACQCSWFSDEHVRADRVSKGVFFDGDKYHAILTTEGEEPGHVLLNADDEIIGKLEKAA